MVTLASNSVRLYRYFVYVALIFILLTFLLHKLQKVVVIRRGDKFARYYTENETRSVVPNDPPSEQIAHWPNSVYANWNRRLQQKLPFVWDSLSGKDRIVEQIDYIPPNLPKKINKSKVIWTSGSFNVPDGTEVFRNCKVRHCTLTSNEVDGTEIDAKMFNIHIASNDVKDHLMRRHSEQIWILYALEGPLATPDYFMLDNLINWTATYRRDSTIVTPYEKWVQNSSSTIKESKNYALGKTRKVAIFVSNCDASNGRMKYVNELKKYIDVHVYGACGDGTYNCDRFVDEKGCYNMLRKHYKFYLAFENSNCRHYITEKFFRNALMSDVLPVVMGGHPDDYRQMAPPHSHIHVEDFPTPKELAEYLHKLDKNDNLYNEYFKWKGTGEFIDTKFWCRLCTLLNDPDKPRLIVDSLLTWWRLPGVCLREDQRWL